MKGEPAGGRKEGSEAFIEEGGKWPCRSLRKEEGRQGEKAVTSRRKRAFYGSTPSLPLLESVSAVSWAVRPPARSLGRPQSD